MQYKKISDFPNITTVGSGVYLPAVDPSESLAINQNKKIRVADFLDSYQGFTQSGSGAVSRSITSKSRDFLSVKDFGAAGDGTTNDTGAFQAAYDAAANKGTILVPAGNYLLTATPSGSKFVKWQCDGALNDTGTSPLSLPGIVDLNFETRKLTRQTITTGSDYAIQEIQRVVNHSGGTAGFVSSALRVGTTIPSGVSNFEWAIVGQVDNYSSSGEPTAIYAQGIRRTGAGATWAFVSEYRDESGSANPVVGCVSQEVDVWANGTDSNNVRVAQDIVIGRPTGVNATGAQCEAAWGSRITAKNNSPAEGRVKKGYSVEIACDCAFDASVATVAAGGTAFRMASNQRLSFTATNDRYFTWNTGELQWWSGGGTPLFEINDTLGPNFFTGVRISGNQVLTSRRTGYTNAMTGTANRATSYATSTITLQQLAERVKAIQDDLTTHGLIGP